VGMYTALHLGIELKSDTPGEVKEILKAMVAGIEPKQTPPDHPFFKIRGWHWTLVSDSYYFKHQSHVEFKYDTTAKRYFLSVTCNLKNYDEDIEKFLDWLTPYINASPGDWLGYTMYEEDTRPTNIFYLEEPTADAYSTPYGNLIINTSSQEITTEEG
jgi:hypothetical protein